MLTLALWCVCKVLQKFLTVFHRFEWDKYCLTLSGPVALDAFDSNGASECRREAAHHA